MDKSARWILAFDATCGTCQELAEAVMQACDSRLEVLPLGRPEVQKWREQALGKKAAPAPTLLRIEAGAVRGWTGKRMSGPLFRRLGARATLRVLHSLGELRHQVNAPPLDQKKDGMLTRAQLLRLGAGVAVGVVLAGRTPAFAEQRHDAAHAWVEANMHRLPQNYNEFCNYPMAYRHAIYSASSPKVKSRLWSEHIAAFRRAHPELSAQQVAALDKSAAMASQVSVFSGPRPDTALHDLSDTVKKAFGTGTAAALLATLGPAEKGMTPTRPAAYCSCTDEDSYCSGGLYCGYNAFNCQRQDGCGTLGLYVCNGVCIAH